MSEVESTIEKIVRQKEETEAKRIENEAQYKLALNGMASTPNGMHVLRVMLNACGVFAVKPSRDAAQLLSDKVLRDFYLSIIRQHLDVELRRELENNV